MILLKKINNVDNGIELFKTIQPGEMKLQDTKNCKIYLNQIWTKYQNEDLS